MMFRHSKDVDKELKTSLNRIGDNIIKALCKKKMAQSLVFRDKVESEEDEFKKKGSWIRYCSNDTMWYGWLQNSFLHNI